MVDVNDNPPVFISYSSSLSVSEVSPVGTVVGSFIVSDPDLRGTVSLSVTCGLQQSNAAFFINSTTGEENRRVYALIFFLWYTILRLTHAFHREICDRCHKDACHCFHGCYSVLHSPFVWNIIVIEIQQPIHSLRKVCALSS